MRYKIGKENILLEVFESGQYLHSTKTPYTRAVYTKRITRVRRIVLDGVVFIYETFNRLSSRLVQSLIFLM